MNKSTRFMNIRDITTYQAGVIQAATHRALQKQCDEILRPYGISKMQWLIIGTVMDSGPDGIRITELSEKLGTTLGYLTNSINLLESKNIVSRITDKNDSRSKYVAINKSYMKTCEEIENFLRDKLRETIYSNIDQNDFRIYMKVLYKLSESNK